MRVSETPDDRETLYFCLIDAPFSAVADTATLPVTIVSSIQQEKARRQYLAENDWKVEMAESAYIDDGQLRFGKTPTRDFEKQLPVE